MTLRATQRDNRRRPRDISKVKCYNCNRFGHIANICPEPKKPRDPNRVNLPQDNFPTEEDAKAGNTPQIPMPHKEKSNAYRREAQKDPAYRDEERRKWRETSKRRREEANKGKTEEAPTETLGMIRERRLSKQETKEYLEGLQGKGATPNKGEQPEAL
ncbi:uncharacterized protein FRV6_14220 [Fusarium oxysporum]|uniref:CCHC-type domain-containing protein n=1 Tax=Fusarium oxysporum TaxID=5507 RepID=A0A2H3TN41_FUSOX|nr:uncharacterized protein FRV6_14220 [Fusarium oxysporum]